uniref:Rho-GAP domain-containing protein n=1 Tax=Caenorhabditis japonica TaxID=281687 RepID=A0A8R1DEK7_CAEJA
MVIPRQVVKKTTDEELKRFESVMLRNTKVANFATTYRKNLAATLTTGFKEENVDKRKKKVEELTMAQDFKEMSVDLDYLKTSCLHHVINAFGTVLHQEVDEKVKLEMALERRVYEEMLQFVDYEKNLNKLKDKLNSVSTDLEIAQKDADKERTAPHQETCDAMQMKYEGLKDSLVTDIFTSSVSKEFSVNEFVLTHMQLKRDYFKKMWEAYNDAIPTVQSMIDNALPRPVFGVSLEEHLSVHREKYAFVLVKCCDFIRAHAMNEKGIFRVSGNAAKVKRIRASLDSGQFDSDERHYQNDPHAVASTLKAYLRELPDPLTQESLQKEWIKAIQVEGDQKFKALEKCFSKMSEGHRENFVYIMKFLWDLEMHKDETSMNAGNLAIVFAPTITGMVFDGMNTYGVMLIEFLIQNGARFFGFTSNERLVAVDISPTSAFSRAQSSISPRSFRPKEKAPPPPTDVPSSSADLIDLQASDDDDFSDDQSSDFSPGSALYRSSTERRPNRPPPPRFQSLRSTFGETPKSRPISYNIAVGARPNDSPLPKPMTASLENIVDSPVAPERKRLSVLSIGGLSRVAPNNHQSSSQESSSGSLVTDGGDNRTLVSLDGELTTNTLGSVGPVQPPPQSTKPKPPLPYKPKDLANESSRL